LKLLLRKLIELLAVEAGVAAVRDFAAIGNSPGRQQQLDEFRTDQQLQQLQQQQQQIEQLQEQQQKLR
jgi:hypothetical protein